MTYFTSNQGETISINVTGRYYIGDPCYCFSHSTDTWDALCASWFIGDNKTGIAKSRNNVEVIGLHTAYGDGNYPGYVNNVRHSFPVDAGMIGVVPVDFIEDDSTFNCDGENVGVIITLHAGDTVWSENGDFYIEGNDTKVVIITNDDDTDYSDEEEYDFYGDDE